MLADDSGYFGVGFQSFQCLRLSLQFENTARLFSGLIDSENEET